MAKQRLIVGIQGGDLQRMLAKDFPQAKTVTKACEMAAIKYGLTAETMRCYASQGVPRGSKAYQKIAFRIREIEWEEATDLLAVSRSAEQLKYALNQQIAAFEQALYALKALSRKIEQNQE